MHTYLRARPIDLCRIMMQVKENAKLVFLAIKLLGSEFCLKNVSWCGFPVPLPLT